jgi:class 3 adenylate cyclase/Ca2+-binding EF-hand superfamily protein
VLSRSEFAYGLKKLDVGFSPDRVDELVRTLDTDNDGIEYAEFASQTVLHRTPKYFFPDPQVADTQLQPGVLAFRRPDTEARYLAAHVPDSLAANAASALALLLVPPALLAYYHTAYADAGLPTLGFVGCAVGFAAALVSCVVMHAIARWKLPRHFGPSGFRYLQIVDAGMALLLGLGLSVAEVVAAPSMRYQGYFHAQVLFLAGYCLCSRHLCWRYGATVAWASLLVYAGCATVATLETWPVQQRFVFNGTGTNGSHTAPREATHYFPRQVGWYGVTIEDPFGHTSENGAMSVCGVFAVVLCGCVTLAGARSELAERGAWDASLCVRTLFEEGSEQDWKMDNLLLEIMPTQVKAFLAETYNTTAIQALPMVTVLVAELADFDVFSERAGAAATLAALNRFYESFDAIAKRLGCEKIKTDYGNRYIAVAGLPVTRLDHATAAAELGLAIVKASVELVLAHPNTMPGVRVGLHSGPVVAGLIGTGPVTYDVWGETVGVAARVMAAAEVNTTLVSTTTASELQARYSLASKGAASLKGSSIKTHVLQGRKYGNGFAQEMLLDQQLGLVLSKKADAGAVDLSSSVQTLCAFPARCDWTVLRQERAREPQRFGDGLRAFGTGFPKPEFGHHRQHGWELRFSGMELDSSLHHHQLTLATMILLMASAEALVQLTCAPATSCPEMTLQIWLEFVALCTPTSAILCTVILGSNHKKYVRHRHILLMWLVMCNSVAYVVYVNYTAPAATADLGWYSTVAVIMYAYFGGYIRFMNAVFATLASTATVVISCLFYEETGTHWGVVRLHLAVHATGCCALGGFERSRRLYFGWWSLLRKFEEEKAKIGTRRANADLGHCEEILHMILPSQIIVAAERESSKSLMAHNYVDASILVIDLAGLTAICTPPGVDTDSLWMSGDAGNKVSLTLAIFHDIVSIVEELAEQHDVVLARISGANITLAGGIPHPCSRTVALARLAHDLLGYVKELITRRCEKVAKGDNNGPDMGLGLRMGLAVGRVAGGLVGFHKFNYSIWGPAVDMARGLEAIADPNTLLCDEDSRPLLAESGEFDTFGSRPVLVRGNDPFTAYEVERSNIKSLVDMPAPSEIRFWKEYELDAEQVVIQMIRESEEAALHDFVHALQEQSRLQLTGKQGIQLDVRQKQMDEVMNEVARRCTDNDRSKKKSQSLQPALSGVAGDLRVYMQTEIDVLLNQQEKERASLTAELRAGARDFLEMLADQWAQLLMGTKLSGTVHLPKASKLCKANTFGASDAYAVVFWNGEKVGQTEVVKEDLDPVWDENQFEVEFYTQATNTLTIEVYDYNEGDVSNHAFLGLATMSGRGAEFLPTSESKRLLGPHPAPAVSDEYVGGRLHLYFHPHHDSEVEEQIRLIWSQVDADGSGVLDRDEMYTVLTRMGRKDIDMDLAMAEVDEDGSGEVDYDEFRKWYFMQTEVSQGMIFNSQEKSTAERIFDQVDIDGSGDVSFDEFSSWWAARAQAGKGDVDEEVLQHSQELFDKYDADGSGELDKDEFEMMLKGLAHEEWCEAASGGRRYYFNIKTQESRWELPELGDELLDMFVDRQATLEVSGGKAAKRLTRLYDEEVSRRRLGISDDPLVHRRVHTLLKSKQAIVQQFVDVSTIMFDATASKIETYVQALEGETVELDGWLRKARSKGSAPPSEWQPRWVQLRSSPSKGRVLAYGRTKREAVSRPFSRCNRPILTEIYLCHACSCRERLRRRGRGQAMHTFDLAGARLIMGVTDERRARMAAAGQPLPVGDDVFTLLTLEPFFDKARGKTFFGQDEYTFAARNADDAATWMGALRVPGTGTAEGARAPPAAAAAAATAMMADGPVSTDISTDGGAAPAHTLSSSLVPEAWKGDDELNSLFHQQ